MIARALLRKLERLQVFSLDLPSILGDPSFGCPEQALVSRIREARRNAPSIIYIPALQDWYRHSMPQTRASLIMLLRQLPPSLPVLILGTMVDSEEEEDEELKELLEIFCSGEKEEFVT